MQPNSTQSLSAVFSLLATNRRFAGLLLASLTLLLAAYQPAWAQFGNNNLAVLVANGTTTNTSVSVIEINKTSANQTAVQTIDLPATGANAIRVSGSGTTTLYASNSADGTLLCFTGHNTENTSSNVTGFQDTKTVITLNNAGTIAYPARYTGTGTNQTRGSTTNNNTDFFIADQGGQYTNNATSASPTGNFRGIKTFGGVVYLSQASGMATNIEVATTSALTGGTITGLPGLTNNSSTFDFYLISSGTNGSTFDVLYIIRNTSATAGTIAKYSLVSGTWTANGTYTTNFGGFALAAEKSGNGAQLYVTTGAGATAANRVVRLTDAAGFNAALDINTDNNVTLFTAAAGTILKGVVFAPKAADPSSVSNLLIERGISVYPNPLPRQQPLLLQFRNSAPARYEVVVYNLNGTQVVRQVVAHPGGSSIHRVELPASLAPGTYIAEFTDTKGSRGHAKIIVH